MVNLSGEIASKNIEDRRINKLPRVRLSNSRMTNIPKNIPKNTTDFQKNTESAFTIDHVKQSTIDAGDYTPPPKKIKYR